MSSYTKNHESQETDRSSTLAEVTGIGLSFQGQLYLDPGRRRKSNVQQILGSGPHVCGMSYE